LTAFPDAVITAMKLSADLRNAVAKCVVPFDPSVGDPSNLKRFSFWCAKCAGTNRRLIDLSCLAAILSYEIELQL
jgi:hypothetical protein